jgi:hypothetical protein
MTHTPAASSTHEKAATLVWIDSREAYLVHWRHGAASVDHLESDVPVHRRTTGGTRHDPGRAHGGGGAPQEDVEGRRLEHLARFVDAVAQRVPADEDVIVIGPGTVRERLMHEITESDRRAHHERRLASRASPPLTEPQLVATLRAEIGEPAPRKRHTRRPVVKPPHVAEPDPLDELEELQED